MRSTDSQWVEVNCEGETTKRKYFGKFEVKPFLTHREKAEAVRTAEKYMFGIETTLDQRQFLTTLAFLKSHIVTIDDKVNWWIGDGLDIHDERPVYQLAEEIKKLQDPEPEKEEEAPAEAEAPKAKGKK
jgi:hypothetical protein